MKYKVGDKVKVVKCTYHTNCKNIGKEFEIERTDEMMVNPYALKECCELFRDEEPELVQLKQFTKSNLKDGDILTYRNEDKRTYINNKLIDENGDSVGCIDTCNEDLTRKNRFHEDLDIVRVERPTQYETVFERKEEILDEAEKRYLSNVIKPFRNKVKFIEKSIDLSNGEFIEIGIKDDIGVMLPYFKNAMYEGMEADKQYTLEELGL